MKTQTSFNPEKSRSTSKEDVDPFYVREKFKSTSKEDADLFYCEEKFRSTSKEDVDLFCYEEKLRSTFKEDVDLFLFIYFILFKKKKAVHMQIIDIQERDYNNYIKTIML